MYLAGEVYFIHHGLQPPPFGVIAISERLCTGAFMRKKIASLAMSDEISCKQFKCKFKEYILILDQLVSRIMKIYLRLIFKFKLQNSKFQKHGGWDESMGYLPV